MTPAARMCPARRGSVYQAIGVAGVLLLSNTVWAGYHAMQGCKDGVYRNVTCWDRYSWSDQFVWGNHQPIEYDCTDSEGKRWMQKQKPVFNELLDGGDFSCLTAAHQAWQGPSFESMVLHYTDHYPGD